MEGGWKDRLTKDWKRWHPNKKVKKNAESQTPSPSSLSSLFLYGHDFYNRLVAVLYDGGDGHGDESDYDETDDSGGDDA